MINPTVKGDRGGPPTSSTLLARVQGTDPDPAAWRRFTDLYRPLVLGWCRQCGLQDADAEDVTQEVFRSVHGAVAEFERGRAGGTLRGWLRTVTRHAVCDWGRRRRREAQGVGGSDAQAALLAAPAGALPDADGERDRDEERTLLRHALTQLLAGFKDQTQEAFWQVVVEGRKPADVARELGVGEHVVYLAKSRILKRLKDEYGELVDL